VCWGALLYIVLFWRLGTPTFWDPDEAHYAQTTRELIERGDWLAPYYDHQPFFDKPVFFHLLQSLPMRVLGPTEFAARLVPALAAGAIILTTWWLGAVLASADVGFLAALLLTVSPAVFALSRYAILDTVFTACLFGGVSLLTVAALRDRPRLQYPGYGLLALAALTKGPLAIALSGLAFLLAIAFSADARRRLLGLRWLLGLAIVAAVAAPWFAYMYWRFGAEFVDGYFLNENLLLFASPPYQNLPDLSFYFRIVAVGLLPWTFLLLGRLVDDLRAVWTRRALPDTFEVLLWSWTLAILGFFSFSRFKLDHYIFPAAPALCLLAARAWTDVSANRTTMLKAVSKVGLVVMGPVLIVVGVVVAGWMQSWMALPAAALLAPVALIVAGAVLIARTRKGALPRVPWAVIAAFGVTYVVLIVWIGPALEQRKVVPDIARWVAMHAPRTTRVATYRLSRWNPALRFYVERHTDVLNTPDEVHDLFAGAEAAYCVMPQPDYEDLVAHGSRLEIVYSRAGLWVTSGRALWRQGYRLTNFVVVTGASHPGEDRARSIISAHE